MAWTKIKKKTNDEPLAASKDAHRDVLPRTGLGVGATLVDGASKFMASYGKVLVPVVLIVIVALTAWWIIGTRSNTSELELRNSIDKAAASATKLEDLRGKMEVVIAEADEAKKLQAYAQYRFAVRAFELLSRPYKAEELKKAVAVFDEYSKKFGEEEKYSAWNARVKSLSSRLGADLAFLENAEKQKLLPWKKDTRFDRPAAKEVDAGNPIVVFKTSEGEVRFELFYDEAPNAVRHFVSLCAEGFFDRTDFSAASFSNHFAAAGPYRGATVLTAGREGRPVGVELKKPTDAKDGDDVDTVPTKNPYTIEYQGSATMAFEAGMIALTRDEMDPSRARTEFMLVLEPSPAIALNFRPLGKVLGGQDAMKVARRLGSADIYYTWVEQKPKGLKPPMVNYDGWPVATEKREKKPEPVRFSKVPQQITEGGENPLIVLELEQGDILIELFEDTCPNTVKNFINLIEERFYDLNCEFYRVEGAGADLAEIYKGGGLRIIQGGNDQSKSRDKYDYNIRNEAVDNDKYDAKFGLDRGGIANARGTIAMARTGDLDGAGQEFFINLKDMTEWDRKQSPYCVFGRVIDGLDLCARVAKDDLILGAKVIRKRKGTEYLPEVKYKDKGIWQKKDKNTPPTEEEIKKAAEEAKKAKDKPAPAPSGRPNFDMNFGG